VKTENGITLVELAIVMIVIGLLIGGVFSGMKLIENAQVTKTVQDLAAIRATTLTFRDTYGRLPGDIRNPATRLPNCTATPCSRAGNGDRTIGGHAHDGSTLVVTDERFVFWHHLAAADLLQNVKPVDDMQFGEGQPELPIGGGLRMTGRLNGDDVIVTGNPRTGHIIVASLEPINGYIPADINLWSYLKCTQVASIDRKIDDGIPLTGKLYSWGACPTALTLSAPYAETGQGSFHFVLGF
jgi:type II secretory pathway pseudopilin PulG